MSYDTFPLALKSTIDKYAKQLADSKAINYLDLDGTLLQATLLESDQPALGWSLSTMVESPRDPMWYLEFEIGGITSIDPAQYTALDIVSLVRSVFYQGAELPIMDYSGVDQPTERLGDLIISSTSISPQQFDRAAGLRMVVVQARALRF